MMAVSAGAPFPAMVPGSPSSWCSVTGSRLAGSVTSCEMIAQTVFVWVYVYSRPGIEPGSPHSILFVLGLSSKPQLCVLPSTW